MQSATNTHVLVVDDNVSIRRLLRRCFEMEGYRVSEAVCGEQVRAFALDDVSLVTLDVMLGDEDGLDVLRDLRARSDVPIIMVTGKTSASDVETGLDVGADDFITKPFRVRDVLERVRSVIDAAPAREKAPKAGANASGLRYRFGDRTADLTDIALSTGGAVPGTGMTGERRYRQDLTQRRSRII